MHPTVSRGRYSPLCLWVERKLGDERQRILARRLLLVVLVSSSLLLAYDTITLPPSINEPWFTNLSGEITHVSSYLDEEHGLVLSVAVSSQPYYGATDAVLLLNPRGEEIEELARNVPTTVSSIVYLPNRTAPEMVLVTTPPLSLATSTMEVSRSLGLVPQDSACRDYQVRESNGRSDKTATEGPDAPNQVTHSSLCGCPLHHVSLGGRFPHAGSDEGRLRV